MPINTADNMVNTYAWMNATNTSTQFMKILNNTDTILMDVLMTAPILAVTNTMLVNAKIMECPAMMLANKRIIKAKGLVKMPNNSMAGMMGTGHFSHMGTSGQRISFQYSLVPNTLTAMNVQSANTKVMAILPVTLPPPGKTGINPITLLIKMKKKAVSR